MTTGPAFDPAALGEVTRCYSVRYERSSKHPPARLWRAITSDEELARWMGYPARVDLRVGGDYFVDFQTDSPDNLDGVIVAIEAERQLRYAWGRSVIEWTITPAASGGCTYTFLSHGMDVRGIPDEQGAAVGWHLWLDRFDTLVDGQPLTTASADTRAALSASYRERMEAAIGPV